MHVQKSSAVDEVFDRYPTDARALMDNLRGLVHEVAESMPGDAIVEETLKWGEPSFVTKHGSTLRMDWKPKLSDHCALYFKCTSLLVATFKDVFGDSFKYEKTRAILLPIREDLPVERLKLCIRAALQYHQIKKMPLLGLA